MARMIPQSCNTTKWGPTFMICQVIYLAILFLTLDYKPASSQGTFNSILVPVDGWFLSPAVTWPEIFSSQTRMCFVEDSPKQGIISVSIIPRDQPSKYHTNILLCVSVWGVYLAFDHCFKGRKKKKEKKKRKKGICRWLSFSFYRDIFPCLRCPSQIYIFFFKLETSKISVYLWNLKYLCNFSHVVEAPTLSHSSHLPRTQEFNTYNLVTCMPLESNAYSSPLPNTSRRQIFVLWFWLFSSLPNICICATYTDILRQTKWIPV